MGAARTHRQGSATVAPSPADRGRRPSALGRAPAAGPRALQRIAGNREVATRLGGARGPRRVLQRMPIEEARDRVAAEHEYVEATIVLETKLAPLLTARPEVHEIADKLVTRLAKVVNAWADRTKQDPLDVYAATFKFEDGKKYYGSFPITGANVKRVFDDPAACRQLRTKLNLAYYAARSSTFAKFVEAAAIDETGSGSAFDVEEVLDENVKKTRRLTVQPGFAMASGLKDIWEEQAKHAPGPGELTAKEIKQIVDKRSAPTPLLGQRSEVMASQSPVVDTRADKVYDKAVGLQWDEQPTLTRADVPDITEQELALLIEGKHKSPPTSIRVAEKRKNWSNKGDKHVRWEMGVASIEVKPGTGTRKSAEAVRGRLDAGISGSTDLMMHLGIHLGLSSDADKKALRLALVAWMLSNRDHSFYEIMTAAAGYGIPFHTDPTNPGAEYEDARNFEPLPSTEVTNFKDLMPGKLMPSHHLSPVRLTPSPILSTPTPFVLPPGVDALQIDGADPELFVAHHERLELAVTTADLKVIADEPTLRRNRVAYQTLRERLSFQWLALHHTGGAPYAEVELERLVAAAHPGVIPAAGALKSKGVPDTTADAAPPIQRLDLARLVLAVESAGEAGDARLSLGYEAVKRHARAVPAIDAFATLNAIRTHLTWAPLVA